MFYICSISIYLQIFIFNIFCKRNLYYIENPDNIPVMIQRKFYQAFLISILLSLASCDRCGNQDQGGYRNSGDDKSHAITFELVIKQAEHKIINTGEVAELELKIKAREIYAQRATYVIKEIEVTKGDLFFGKGYKGDRVFREEDKITVGDRFTYTDRLETHLTQIIFKPNGEIGQATIRITLCDDEKYRKKGEIIEGSVSASLEIKPYFKAKFIGPDKKLFIRQTKPASLDIQSIDQDAKNQTYTVKKLQITHGDLQFENGEVFQEGSKLKVGKHNLIFKAPTELEDKKVEGSISMTIEDEKGLTSDESCQFEISNISFKVDITRTRWSRYDPKPPALFNLFNLGAEDELLDKGFIEVEINITNGSGKKHSEDCKDLKKEFGNNIWKIVECKSSDGSTVTIADIGVDDILGEPLETYSDDQVDYTLFLKLDSITLENSTITLRVGGPLDTFREVDIEVPVGRKFLMLENRMDQFYKTLVKTKQDLENFNIMHSSKYSKNKVKNDPYYRNQLQKIIQQIEDQTSHFESELRQIKDPKLLSAFPDFIQETMKKIYDAIKKNNEMKENAKTYYGV